jgi:hypothetical protein
MIVGILLAADGRGQIKNQFFQGAKSIIETSRNKPHHPKVNEGKNLYEHNYLAYKIKLPYVYCGGILF